LTLDSVRLAAARFHGEMEQMPPSYSAKKIAGTPAYKLARAGKPVELKAVPIYIGNFEIHLARRGRGCLHDEHQCRGLRALRST
jgi:tRNA U55 pseudouridine synthase TruB